jgi:hypothetical protein
MFRFDALFQGGVHAHSLLTSSIHAHTLFAICFCSLHKAREVKTERVRARAILRGIMKGCSTTQPNEILMKSSQP